MAGTPLLLLLGAAATHLATATAPDMASTSGSGSIKSTVFTHGEEGWTCFRIPGTLALLPSNVMLSFAAARSFSGDVSNAPDHTLQLVSCDTLSLTLAARGG